jgi:hypothetical protein
MRILLLLLIVCLLAAAPVSAIAASPAAVPGITKVSSVIRPDSTIIPARTIVTTPADVWVTLGINSFPSGAAITVDGDPVEGLTPVNLGLRPGFHTLRLTLAGYEDSVTGVSLQAGSPKAVDIVLEPSRKMVAARENVSAMRTIGTQTMALRTIVPGVLVTPEILDSCVSGQQCLTLAEADELYAANWWYVEGAVCGYGMLNNTTSVPKYCTGGTLGQAVQPGRVPAVVTVPTGIRVRVVNASPDLTALPSGIVSPTPRVLGAKRQVGVFESVLGFFNGLFSKPPVCPQGKTACGSECVDLMTHSSHCGSCDYVCFEPGVCENGECVEPSVPPWSNPLGDIIL